MLIISKLLIKSKLQLYIIINSAIILQYFQIFVLLIDISLPKCCRLKSMMTNKNSIIKAPKYTIIKKKVINSTFIFNSDIPTKIKLDSIYNKAHIGFLTKKLKVIPVITIIGTNILLNISVEKQKI
jgi:hypothetical protein